MTFKQYLRKRRETHDSAGDFVKDALQDRRLPLVKSWEQLEEYLYEDRFACIEAVEGAKVVWTEYKEVG